MTATSVAKTALIRLAEGLALQGAAHGVRAFAVHPGLVKTELLQAYGFPFPEEAYQPPERAVPVAVRLDRAPVVVEAVDGVVGRGRGHRFGLVDGARQIQPRVSSPDDVAVQ